MVISQPQEIILHIIIVLHQRCLNCSECFRDTLCSIHAITTSELTHRNGAIKAYFLHESFTEGSSADYSLFILSLHALALHLAVKILLQIFLYEDLSVSLTYICRLYFLGTQQDRTLVRNQYY